jgi:hypothetical protein
VIEVALRNYLEEELEDVPVVMERPKNPPEKYVLLRLTDGGMINHVDAATFFVDVFAKDLYSAAVLRDRVKDLMFNAITLDGISHASMGGERANTDSANHTYVYELTYNFYFYREEI